MSSNPSEDELGSGVTHHYAEVNGVRLHYAESGSNNSNLVILFHGFPECWYSWRHQLVALGKRHHVIAPDLVQNEAVEEVNTALNEFLESQVRH